MKNHNLNSLRVWRSNFTVIIVVVNYAIFLFFALASQLNKTKLRSEWCKMRFFFAASLPLKHKAQWLWCKWNGKWASSLLAWNWMRCNLVSYRVLYEHVSGLCSSVIVPLHAKHTCAPKWDQLDAKNKEKIQNQKRAENYRKADERKKNWMSLIFLFLYLFEKKQWWQKMRANICSV